MSKFSINDIMNEQTKSEAAGLFKTENIHINKIIPSSANLYGIRDIDELAANIEAIGLQHNLVVKAENSDGYYEIISGERRWLACKQLFENGNKIYEYLPCKIENESSSKMNELRLIYANAMARELTSYEKMEQTRRIKELLYVLKNEGHEFNGRMSKIAAEILEVSPAQVKRLEKINNDLSGEFKEEFKSGNIGVTAAYEISTLPEAEQTNVYKEFKQSGTVDVKPTKKARELPLEQPRWRAKKGGEYYFIDRDCKIEEVIDDYDFLDNTLYNLGNYFKNESDVKAYAQKWRELFAQNLR